ncbi:peptidylprolyl isomerase [Paenibacillus alkalitolerans]|uniref:peptidylprolyl isomerase n=1 Tax=Paenibacillus alkalitolerans TaxID=2799335 RepID=UPI0018F5CA6C|nr:peptidylprolyl isomerase [Paenibacillus alkalitolerans]
MAELRQNRKWIIIVSGILVLFAIYVALFPPVNQARGAAGTAEAVAKVNGVEIDRNQLFDAMFKSGGNQMLQQMIDEELIRQETEKVGISVTDEDIEKEIDSIRATFSSDEEFEQALQSYGMTMESLKKDVETQAKLRKLLEPNVTVTDEDIKKYYDENLESLKTPEQVRASHILVKTKEEADAVLTELNKGADFAELAKEKSTDTGSAEAGGDLDYFGKGVMEEAFEKAAFALEVGKLSEIVETSHGFHIIKVTDRKDEYTPTLEEKKEDIREQLISEGISNMSTSWLEEVRSKAKIENYLETL